MTPDDLDLNDYETAQAIAEGSFDPGYSPEDIPETIDDWPPTYH